MNQSVLYCDFTTLDLPITEYGTYIGRVRAQRGQESSVWVESRPLTLDVNTTIGPPSVTLVSNGVHMTINIRDPDFRVSTLRRIYNGVIYNITYWREGEEDKYELSWSQDRWQTIRSKVSFTVQYLPNRYFRALYMLRLRANSGRLHSHWVGILPGQGRVELAPAGPLLDVRISDPLTSTNGSVKELYTQMYYRVVYWEHTDTRSHLKGQQHLNWLHR
ncbi:hypothetical protein CRUP_027703, partial [Coryphaenoides rupestris]